MKTSSFILRSTSDYNGAMAPKSDDAIWHQKLRNSGWDEVHDTCVGTGEEIRENLLKPEEGTAFLILTGHGTPKSIELSDGNSVTEKNAAAIFNGVKFLPDAVIVLRCCCRNEKNSVARKINKLTGRRVVAVEKGICTNLFLIRNPTNGELEPLLIDTISCRNVTLIIDKKGTAQKSPLKYSEIMRLAAEQLYPEAIKWCLLNFADLTKTPKEDLPSHDLILQSMARHSDYGQYAHVYAELAFKAFYEDNDPDAALDWIELALEKGNIDPTQPVEDVFFKDLIRIRDTHLPIKLALEAQAEFDAELLAQEKALESESLDGC